MGLQVILGPLFPQIGNNANLMLRVISTFGKNTSVQLHSISERAEMENGTGSDSLPTEIIGFPVMWHTKKPRSIAQFINRIIARVVDPKGFSDYMAVKQLTAGDWRKSISASDAVITTMEPFPAADAAARLTCKKKILYMMDPPASVSGGISTTYRNRRLSKILATHDLILTTLFIKRALASNGFKQFESKLIPVGFPMIVDRHLVQQRERDDDPGHTL